MSRPHTQLFVHSACESMRANPAVKLLHDGAVLYLKSIHTNKRIARWFMQGGSGEHFASYLTELDEHPKLVRIYSTKPGTKRSRMGVDPEVFVVRKMNLPKWTPLFLRKLVARYHLDGDLYLRPVTRGQKLMPGLRLVKERELML